MVQILRQSTAADIPVGPFPDNADGFTPETALTITQPDVRLTKNGAAFAQKSAAQTLTHMENSFYSCNLSATDTNTVGRLTVAIYETGALIWWQHFQIVEEAVYDMLYGAAATGNPPGAQAAAAAALTAYDPPTHTELTSSLAAQNDISPAEVAVEVSTELAAYDAATGSDVAAVIADTEDLQLNMAILLARTSTLKGTAQGPGPGSNTIQLAVGAISVDDEFNEGHIFIADGTGVGQFRGIVDSIAATDVLEVIGDWEIAPDNTSVYSVVGKTP